MDDGIMKIYDVAYVPDFKVNLFSVSRLTDDGGEVLLTSKSAIITLPDGNKYTVPRVGNLYTFNTYNHDSPALAAATNNNNDVDNIKTSLKLLHEKCGHLNYQKLCMMIKNNSIIIDEKTKKTLQSEGTANKNMSNIITSLIKSECEGCLKGKMSRMPMTGTIQYDANEFLDEWHVDTIGPISIETLKGSRYILNMIDIKTKLLLTEIVKNKCDVSKIIIQKIKQHQNQTNKKLKTLRSDQGKEIVNNELNEFLVNNGTTHTTSTPYTPQHNAIIERCNRTLCEMAKCMMNHCNCYIPLWGEAIMCAKYILNRITTKSNPIITPFEQRYNKKPNIKHLHIFGSDAYIYNHKQHRQHKFDETSVKGIFVGYDENNDTYFRIYNTKTFKIDIVRDVKIFDNSFNEMKKLVAYHENNNENNNNNNYNIFNENDYLPDNVEFDDIFDTHCINNNNNIVDSQTNINNDNTNINVNAVANNNVMAVPLSSSSSNNNNIINKNNNIVNNNNNNNNDNNDNNNNSKAVSKNIKKNNNNDNHKSSSVVIGSRQSTRVTAQPNHYTPGDFRRNHALSVVDEPSTYKEALQQSDANEWLKAMNEEFQAHEKNNTWSIVDKNNMMNVIGCRWVYKKKKDENGNVKKYKARLVAKGYNQQQGIDYNDTFAPVLKYKSLRILLALSTINKNINIKQLDVKTAFLNAKVSEDIYMEIPDGMAVPANIKNIKIVLKLNKALYGIKQAPNEWNNDINHFLINELQFKRCIKDTCIYVKTSKNNNNIIIGLFVDDIIVSYDNDDENEYNINMNKLKNKYEMSDLGDINHILGMKVSKKNNSLYIDQQTYIHDKLLLFNMLSCNSSPTP